MTDFLYFKRNIFLLSVLMLSVYSSGWSLDLIKDGKLGVSGTFSKDNHKVDLLSIDEIGTCCPKELEGSGNSKIITLDYGLNIVESSTLQFSFGLAFRNSKSEALENEVINLDSTDITGTFKHLLEMDYTSLIFKYSYHQDFAGTFGFGAYIGYEYLLGNNFLYQEDLITPEDRGVFKDTGTRRRNKRTGELKSLSVGTIHFGIYLSKEFPLDVNFNWIAVPKIGFNQMLSYLDKNSGWTYNSIFIGVSISRKLMAD